MPWSQRLRNLTCRYYKFVLARLLKVKAALYESSALWRRKMARAHFFFFSSKSFQTQLIDGVKVKRKPSWTCRFLFSTHEHLEHRWPALTSSSCRFFLYLPHVLSHSIPIQFSNSCHVDVCPCHFRGPLSIQWAISSNLSWTYHLVSREFLESSKHSTTPGIPT